MITLRKISISQSTAIGLFHASESNIELLLAKGLYLRYSDIFSCWYISYSKEAFQQFKLTNLPYCIHEQSGTTDKPKSKSDKSDISPHGEPADRLEQIGYPQVSDINNRHKKNMPLITWNAYGFRVKIPYNKADVQFLRSLVGSWWQTQSKSWLVKSDLFNLEQIQQHFQAFDDDQYAKIYELIGLKQSPRLVEIYQTPEHLGKMVIKIKGYGSSDACVKQIPNRQYDPDLKRWVVDFDNTLLQRILDHYSSHKYKIINRLVKVSQTYQPKQQTQDSRITYLLSKHAKEKHTMLTATINVMVRRKYSWRTIQSYTGKLIRVVTYYSKHDIKDISAEQINAYLSYLSKQGVSHSTINLIHSAVKFYIEQVIYLVDFELKKLKRPKKHFTIPSILSIQEVDKLLRASNNLKHTTILYTLYGGGLRLSEVLNLRVKDIFWERNQLLIKTGKGGKDRMVMLSVLMKKLLISYFDSYKPEYWLFEGSNKRQQYSRSSVTKIVKAAAKKAGLTRRVTPHTLRHCFATHLLDSGVDCRYIQELLGHKDIRTTLIYTHVTNRDVTKIQSPLDLIKPSPP